MKDQELRLIPIIDAGVKVESGYEVYEEGVEKDTSASGRMEVISWQPYGLGILISRIF